MYSVSLIWWAARLCRETGKGGKTIPKESGVKAPMVEMWLSRSVYEVLRKPEVEGWQANPFHWVASRPWRVRALRVQERQKAVSWLPNVKMSWKWQRALGIPQYSFFPLFLSNKISKLYLHSHPFAAHWGPRTKLSKSSVYNSCKVSLKGEVSCLFLPCSSFLPAALQIQWQEQQQPSWAMQWKLWWQEPIEPSYSSWTTYISEARKWSHFLVLWGFCYSQLNLISTSRRTILLWRWIWKTVSYLLE